MTAKSFARRPWPPATYTVQPFSIVHEDIGAARRQTLLDEWRSAPSTMNDADQKECLHRVYGRQYARARQG